MLLRRAPSSRQLPDNNNNNNNSTGKQRIAFPSSDELSIRGRRATSTGPAPCRRVKSTSRVPINRKEAAEVPDPLEATYVVDAERPSDPSFNEFPGSECPGPTDSTMNDNSMIQGDFVQHDQDKNKESKKKSKKGIKETGHSTKKRDPKKTSKMFEERTGTQAGRNPNHPNKVKHSVVSKLIKEVRNDLDRAERNLVIARRLQRDLEVVDDILAENEAKRGSKAKSGKTIDELEAKLQFLFSKLLAIRRRTESISGPEEHPTCSEAP